MVRTKHTAVTPAKNAAAQIEPDWSGTAALAYEAYFDSKHSGQPMQPFSELMDSTRAAWVAVAKTVIENRTADQMFPAKAQSVEAAGPGTEADVEAADLW